MEVLEPGDLGVGSGEGVCGGLIGLWSLAVLFWRGEAVGLEGWRVPLCGEDTWESFCCVGKLYRKA